MPMIDLHVTAGTFADPHALAREAASIVMRVEQVPDIPMFRENTAAFIHELADGAISDVTGDGRHVRVQVEPKAPVRRQWGHTSPNSEPPSRPRRSQWCSRGCCARSAWAGRLSTRC